MKRNMIGMIALALGLGMNAPSIEETKTQQERARRTPDDVDNRRAKNAAKRARRAARSKS